MRAENQEKAVPAALAVLCHSITASTRMAEAEASRLHSLAIPALREATNHGAQLRT
jgi:hypothetical protein